MAPRRVAFYLSMSQSRRRQRAAFVSMNLAVLLAAVYCFSCSAASATTTHSQHLESADPAGNGNGAAERDDLDNSIQAPDAGGDLWRNKASSDQQQLEKQQNQPNGNSNQPDAGADEENLIPSSDSTTLKRLERRLDRLEFELRKSMHQMRSFVTPSSDANDSQVAAKQIEAKWTSLSERLELMEKFIGITTQKLYETEQRVKQLEKCECRLGCKWSDNQHHQHHRRQQEVATNSGPFEEEEEEGIESSAAAAQNLEQQHDNSAIKPQREQEHHHRQGPKHNNNNNNTTRTILSHKRDGEVWENKCDVCSCHRGQVRCSHVVCPELNCPDPRHVIGKCCPVCYKPCAYKSQVVRHGNKLVINSNQDTCRECMCLDGRLKCQRVELERRQRSIPPFWEQSQATDQADDLSAARDDDYDEDDELEQSLTLAGAARSRRHSAGLSVGPPLVCPQVDCPKEEQLRLENDCCTYCRSFDFCTHYKAHSHQHQCHPTNAICHNTLSNLSSDIFGYFKEHPQRPLMSIDQVIRCQCKSGFVGDGRQCSDIDECSGTASAVCDPSTTNCVNKQGGFECRCKRGFKPAIAGDVGTYKQQKCIDIDECADGKLNTCHPQARCINLRGSYRCQCKRGYLGNGLECHKWFSSDPKVAAYLYYHSAGAGAGASSSPLLLQLNDSDSLVAKTTTAPLNAKVHLPLGSLDEDSDDDPSASSADYSSEEEDYDKSWPPEDVKWEPLHPQQQQVLDKSANQIPTITYDPTAITMTPPNVINTQAPQEAISSDSTALPKALHLRAMDLNTRTMFFQPPPPRFWQEQNATQVNSNEHEFNKQPNATEQTFDAKRADNANYSKSDSNDPVYIQRSSETLPYQRHDTTTTTNPSLPITTATTTKTNNRAGKLSLHPQSQPRLGSQSTLTVANSSPNGYKRGTIIASATTASGKGRGASSSSASVRLYPRFRANIEMSNSANTSWVALLVSNLAKIIQMIGQLSNTPFFPLLLSSFSIQVMGFNHNVAFYFS